MWWLLSGFYWCAFGRLFIHFDKLLIFFQIQNHRGSWKLSYSWVAGCVVRSHSHCLVLFYSLSETEYKDSECHKGERLRTLKERGRLCGWLDVQTAGENACVRCVLLNGCLSSVSSGIQLYDEFFSSHNQLFSCRSCIQFSGGWGSLGEENRVDRNDGQSIWWSQGHLCQVRRETRIVRRISGGQFLDRESW